MESFANILLSNSSVVIALIVGVCVLLFGHILRSFRTDKVEQQVDETVRKQPSREVQKARKKPVEQRWARGKHQNQHYSHPWHLTSFKGHTGNVLDLDYSSNGKYLASCSDDRTVFLWDIKDFKQKDHKSVRINVEYDFATFIKWSPDNKAFLVHRYQNGNIEVYKVEKKKDGGIGHANVAHSFPKVHEEEVVGMSMAVNGKFIMTCSKKNDLIIWDLKGNILKKIDTCLMTTSSAKISTCGNFVFASGFSPDVKVWEVSFDKSGEFHEVKRAFELTGHSSGIYDVSCNVDCSKMATVSKDRTWKLFNTKVEFKKGQDPDLLITGKFKNPNDDVALIALSQNNVIVISIRNYLQFFSGYTGVLDQTIENVYEGNITRILFDATGRYLLTSGYRQVHVFHNVTGYKCDIHIAEEKLKDRQTSATKERLQQIIENNQLFLNEISK